MLFNFDLDYNITIDFCIDHNIIIDDVTKKDLLDNFIENNCDILHFRDNNDIKCSAKIVDYKIMDDVVNIKCDIYSYNLVDTNYKKGKYDKVNYSEKRKLRLLNSIGITKAQLIHSQDVETINYIPIELYLKDKLPELFEIKLYELSFDGTYEVFRHKNLFSEYRDEISDFEKLTFILKDKEGDVFFLGHKLDSNILSYKHEEKTLQRRKDARNLAKTIYQNPNGFSKKELINLLKNKNLFVKVTSIIEKEDKRAYSNINVSDMNEHTLNEEYINNVHEKKRSKQTHYKPQRLIKKQRRYIKRRQIKEGLEDYYIEKDSSVK